MVHSPGHQGPPGRGRLPGPEKRGQTGKRPAQTEKYRTRKA